MDDHMHDPPPPRREEPAVAKFLPRERDGMHARLNPLKRFIRDHVRSVRVLSRQHQIALMVDGPHQKAKDELAWEEYTKKFNLEEMPDGTYMWFPREQVSRHFEPFEVPK